MQEAVVLSGCGNCSDNGLCLLMNNCWGCRRSAALAATHNVPIIQSSTFTLDPGRSVPYKGGSDVSHVYMKHDIAAGCSLAAKVFSPEVYQCPAGPAPILTQLLAAVSLINKHLVYDQCLALCSI